MQRTFRELLALLGKQPCSLETYDLRDRAQMELADARYALLRFLPDTARFAEDEQCFHTSCKEAQEALAKTIAEEKLRRSFQS